MDERIYDGFWWILGEDEQQHGRLDLSTRGEWILETYNPRDMVQAEAKSIDSFVGTIQGFANAKEITLFKCNRVGRKEILSGSGSHTHIVQRFRAETVMVGGHFDSYEEITLKEVNVRFSDLDKWIGHTIQASPPKDKTIRLKLPELELAKVSLPPHAVSVKLLALEKTFFSSTEIRVGLDPLFKLEFDEKAGYEKIKFLVCGLQRFLCFAMRTAVVPLKTSAYTENSREVEIYSNYDMPINKGAYNVHNRLFLFSEIEDFFQNCMLFWFEKLKNVESTINLLQLGRFYQSTPFETTFLNLAQAAETYHRERGESKGKYQSDNRWKKGIYKTLIDALPEKLLGDSSNELEEDFRKAIKDSLRYAHSYSLNTRLKDLLHDAGKTVPEGFLKDSEATEKTANDIKDIRNYYTHYSGNEEKKRKASDATLVLELSEARI
ncbi:MAG: hypothetical protein U5L04_13285 [Trueperaceae bacterium]|nr:hypothetical protein [Trueperaceae bacterium]